MTPTWAQSAQIGPELVLAGWGLLVLLADLAFFRGASSAQRRKALGWIALIGCLAAFWATTPLVLAGDERDPVIFSGTIAADALCGWFDLLLVLLLGFVIAISMSWSFTERWGEYFALLLWATVGMMFLIAAEELLTLFLSLETMTICLYLLTAFETDRRRSAEGGMKYFVYGSVSSALFLFGLSLIYGLTGSTRLIAVRAMLVSTSTTGLGGNIAGAVAVLLMMVGFGFKISAVPFHQWAPDAYEGAPAPVTAWVASGSKIASFIALMKVMLIGLASWSSTPGRPLSPGWVGILALISALTMTYGNFAALAQTNFKRLLAYSSISHAGYLLIGVLAAAVSVEKYSAVAAVLYYLIVYGFTTVATFGIAAWVARDLGSDEIDDLNGLAKRSPLLAASLMILMLSLIGIPPTAGFFGKLYMFMEALNLRQVGPAGLTLVTLVALGLLNSVVSAFYYVRVLKAMYLRESKKPLAAPSPGVTYAVVCATIVVLGFGLANGPPLLAMQTAASEMLSSNDSAITGPVAVANYVPRKPETDKEKYARYQEMLQTPGLPEKLRTRIQDASDRAKYLIEHPIGAAAGPGGGAPATKKAQGRPAAKKAQGGPANKKAQGGPAGKRQNIDGAQMRKSLEDARSQPK